eukprot:2546091-Ditylum_brightwellii.AAC.1
MASAAREYCPEKLRDAIVDVYNGTCSEREASTQYDLNSRLIRTAIEALLECQSDRVMNERCMLTESSTSNQIYRWASKYANAAMTKQPYTHEELKKAAFCHITAASFYPKLSAVFSDIGKTVSVSILTKDSVPSKANLRDEFGVPERTLRRFVKKKKIGCPTNLMRDEEAMFVATAEIEAAHSKT